MAVPMFDSTPEMPILPRMEVKLAKTAEPAAYKSQLTPSFAAPVDCFFSIMRYVPTAMSTMPMPFRRLRLSWRKMTASRMVSTVLDLSTGTTLLMSPICSAWK